MGRPCKCAICGQVIGDGENAVPYKNRKVHKDCLEATAYAATKEREQLKKEAQKKIIEAKKEKAAPKLKMPKKQISEEEFQSKEKLWHYIEHLSKKPIQLKDKYIVEAYVNKYNFTYDGIQETLRYCYEIMDKPVDPEKGMLGLIPYYYEEALAAQSKIQQVNATNQEILNAQGEENLLPHFNEENYVKIAKRHLTITKKEPKLIDITKII